MTTILSRSLAAAIAVALLSTGSSQAQEAKDPAAAPADAVEARLAALEKKLAEPPKPSFPEVKLGGVVQADGRFYFADKQVPLVDGFLLRRVRLDTSARLTSGLSARIQVDLAGGALQTLDAYADARWVPGVTLRVGKFTPPVGIERLVSTPAVLFIEYAQTSNLVPNRDLGLQVSGDATQYLSWAVGLFDGTADAGNNEGDTSDDKDVVARLAVKPIEGLTIHLAGSHGARAGTPAAGTTAAVTLLPSYKADSQGSTYFKYNATVLAVGEHTRYTAAGSYYLGGLGVLAEYVASRQRVVNTSAAPVVVTIARPTNKAWQVAASYVVTGEKNSEGVVRPASGVEAGGLGAIRVKARYQQLDVDDALFVGNVFATATASATKATGTNVGLDWWPVPALRLEAEYSHTTFKGGAAAGANKPGENAVLARAQVAF